MQLPSAITSIGVVVPAHDEQDWLPTCLKALATAAAAVPVPVDVVVVCDACTDGTRGIAERAGVRVIETSARNVGVARAAGFAALDAVGLPERWLVTTDADTLVPADWLIRMLAHADAGWDAVVGTVEVLDWDRSGRPATVRNAWTTRYSPVTDHQHVHGANLGVRASAYAAVGGVPMRSLSEDAGLVSALVAAGVGVLRAADLAVCTSARRSTRVSGGFSSYLDGLPA